MKLNLFVLEIPVALLIVICYNTASSVAVVLGSYMKGASTMTQTKVSVNRKWYGKVPLDRSGSPFPGTYGPNAVSIAGKFVGTTQRANAFPKVSRTERRQPNTQEKSKKKWIKAGLISPRKSLLKIS